MVVGLMGILLVEWILLCWFFVEPRFGIFLWLIYA